MKKFALVLALVLASSAAEAKVLSVQCEGDYYSMSLETEITNIHQPHQLRSLVFDYMPVTRFRDTTRAQYYEDGKITLSFSIGQSLFSSLNVEVEKCEDDFTATGHATFEKYVGGFAGTQGYGMKCTCSLK